MTPAARATALLVAVFAAAFALAAGVAFHLAVGEPGPEVPRPPVGPRHLKVGRHRAAPRREWTVWVASVVVRFYRWEDDGGPKAAVSFASLFLFFALVMGATQ